MPTDIADVIKDVNKRLIAAEGSIFGFTKFVHALVASNSVSTVILREHIELLRSRLVPADATDEATALYIEAARDLDERNAQSRRCANFPSHSRRQDRRGRCPAVTPERRWRVLAREAVRHWPRRKTNPEGRQVASGTISLTFD
jgi:hypothetical protein